jgi:phage baseplate assembly protein V
MVSRGVLALVNDALKLQSVQVTLLNGEVKDLERFQNYGFSSSPLPGAEAIAVFVGGNRDHGIVLAIDDRDNRFKGLQPGDSVQYDNRGQSIHLTSAGIVITGAGFPITINDASHVQVNGGDVLAGSISLTNHHHNPATGAPE